MSQVRRGILPNPSPSSDRQKSAIPPLSGYKQTSGERAKMSRLTRLRHDRPTSRTSLEGLDNVEWGDEPRVQQQVVPLSAAGSIPAAPPAPTAASAAAPDYHAAAQRDIEAMVARASAKRGGSVGKSAPLT
jgi:hypothetical protein